MHRSLPVSPLVRLLGAWHPVDAQASGADFAERLSVWLNAFDAIGLQSAQQAIRAVPAPARPSAAQLAQARALSGDLQRVRSVLAHAIAQDTPALRAADAGYAAFHARHAELQRQMDLMLNPLRLRARETLSRVSGRLRQLAVLDAAMEQVLAKREQALLPALPALLKQRFAQLQAAPQPDAAGSWLDAFRQEWRQALLAELDLRLAPVAGLVEAAANEWDDPR